MSRQGKDDDATEILTDKTVVVPVSDVDLDVTELNFDGDSTLLDGADKDPSTLISTAQAGVTGQRRIPSRSRARWLTATGLLLMTALAVLYLYSSRIAGPDRREESVIPDQAYTDSFALVSAALAEGYGDSLVAQLWATAQAHPGDRDLELLLRDATLYEDMVHSAERGKLLTLADQRRDSTFSNGRFERAALTQLDPLLPRPGSLEVLHAAREQWRGGALIDALNQMRKLSSADDEQFAAQRLTRYGRLIEQYDVLSRMRDDPDYPLALISFYLSVDPMEDQFFLQRLDADIEAAQDLLPRAITDRLRESLHQWSRYENSGGITAKIRRDSSLNSRFQLRAAELAAAQHSIATIIDSFSANTAGLVLEALYVPAQLSSEVNYQRGRLASLLVYNEQPMLATRLAMLPPVGSRGVAE